MIPQHRTNNTRHNTRVSQNDKGEKERRLTTPIRPRSEQLMYPARYRKLQIHRRPRAHQAWQGGRRALLPLAYPKPKESHSTKCVFSQCSCIVVERGHSTSHHIKSEIGLCSQAMREKREKKRERERRGVMNLPCCSVYVYLFIRLFRSFDFAARSGAETHYCYSHHRHHHHH